jgi:hypothetical protein
MCLPGFVLVNPTSPQPQCDACPANADCAGAALVTRPAFWISNLGVVTGDTAAQLGNLTLVPCPNPAACVPPSNASVLAAANGTQWVQAACAPGYNDTFCARCDADYFANGVYCSPCQSWFIVVIPLSYIAALALIVAYLLLVPGSSLGLFKVMGYFISTLMLLVKTSVVQWPPAIAQLLSFLSSASSFSPFAIECLAPGVTAADLLVVAISAPAVLCVLGVLAYVGGLVVRRVRTGSWSGYYQHARARATKAVSCGRS